MRTIMFITVLFLSGCEQASIESVIAEKNKCVSAGLDYSISDFGKVKCIKPRDEDR